MSLSIDKLSLLGSLTPLRHNPDGSSLRQGNGFSERLDKALGVEGASSSDACDTARKLAERLTLQMLQSSIDLAGDSASGSATASGTAPLSPAAAFLQMYRDNRAAGETSTPAVSVPSPPLFPDVSDDLPAASPPAPSSASRTDTAWLDPIISRASRKHGVDVGLIKAVIKAESDFNTHAVSRAGARGLMQLMPATARSLGVNDSFDPEQNVMAGTRFLKDMLHRYDGNVDAALAAYNWGPGNVDKRPDSLPRETREYLVRVKQLYASYTG
jgi:soluble lytic murein transglycosylase-like protein